MTDQTLRPQAATDVADGSRDVAEARPRPQGGHGPSVQDPTGRAPLEAVMGTATAYWLSRCLHLVAEVGVADALGDRAAPATALADRVGVDADALGRVLRLLSAHGVFERGEDGSFGHNAASRLLRTDHPRSVRAFVRFVGSPLVWQSWGALGDSLRTGATAVRTLVPEGLFGWLADRPAEAMVFEEAMTAKAHGQVASVVAAYDFTPFGSIADVGGGRGHLLLAALQAAPGARGVLFDLPHVVGHVREVIASDRLELRAGDFFHDPLPSCDAYLLMDVVHNWADEEATALLGAVRRAAPTGAKVLVVEAIVPEGAGPHPALAMDVNMLVLVGGRERTRREYEALLAGAGLRLDRVVGTPGAVSILEASVPA